MVDKEGEGGVRARVDKEGGGGRGGGIRKSSRRIHTRHTPVGPSRTRFPVVVASPSTQRSATWAVVAGVVVVVVVVAVV